MPYADPTEKKAYDLALYLRRYQDDPEFRADEAFRKLTWYQRNRNKILARYRLKRKKIRQENTAAKRHAQVSAQQYAGDVGSSKCSSKNLRP